MPKLCEDPCRIQPHSIWYDIKPTTSKHVFLKDEDEAKENSDMDPKDLKEAYEKGKTFLMEDTKLYEKFQSQHNSSQSQMHKLFLKGGTLTDRISVLTLSIQHSPVHHIEALEKLVMMVGKKNRTESMLALSAVKDLFTGTGLTSNGLLPTDRKLVSFSQRPSPCVSGIQLALWVYEDLLKQVYYTFLKHLETLLKDTVLYTKKQALKCVLTLFIHGPEQEANLLHLILHKFGDPDAQMATFASHSMTQLLTHHHPAMKSVVCEACRHFLQNSNTPLRAHYTTLMTINQFVLSKNDHPLALRMVEFYFERIKAHLVLTEALQKEEKGLRKIQLDRKKLLKHRKKKKTIDFVPSSHPSLKKEKEKDGKEEISEEKVTRKEALRQKKEDLIRQSKVLSAILNGLHRAFPFLNLTTLPETWMEYLNQFFVWTHHEDPVVQLHALHVLFSFQRVHVALEDRFATTFYSFLQDLTRRQMPLPVQSMFLTLFRKVLLFWIQTKTIGTKKDQTLRTVTAWLVRGLDICFYQIQAGWIVAFLGILEETLRFYPPLQHSLITPTPTHFTPNLSRVPDTLPGTPFFHLHLLCHHYHPSIRCFAEKILLLHPFHLTKEIQGDPLDLFSIVRFLDHFAQKKPKPISMEKRSIHAKSMPMETILHGKQHILDQEFLKHYESVKPITKKKAAKPSIEKEEKDEDDDDEMDEDEIEEAIMSSIKKVHGVKFDDDHEEEEEDLDDDSGFDDEEEEDGSDDVEEDEDAELHFSEEEEEDEVEEDRGHPRRSGHHSVPSVPLSGTPFASAQAYSELLESQLGLDDDVEDMNEGKRYKKLQKLKKMHQVVSEKRKNNTDKKVGSKYPVSPKRGHGSKRGGPPRKKKKF